MNGFDDKGAIAPRREIWCKTLLGVVLLGVIMVPIALLAYQWATRMALLQAMLGENSYSLNNDPATVSQVKAILPRLIEIHRESVTECGNSRMIDLSRMDAFNRRIKSWHAILTATEFTSDSNGLAYVDAFVNSDHALPEEATSGKDALQQASGKP